MGKFAKNCTHSLEPSEAYATSLNGLLANVGNSAKHATHGTLSCFVGWESSFAYDSYDVVALQCLACVYGVMMHATKEAQGLLEA